MRSLSACGQGTSGRCFWKNNLEESYANEGCHSFFDSERPLLTRIRYLPQFALALASFGAHLRQFETGSRQERVAGGAQSTWSRVNMQTSHRSHSTPDRSRLAV